jgi:hypothetical protein
VHLQTASTATTEAVFECWSTHAAELLNFELGPPHAGADAIRKRTWAEGRLLRLPAGLSFGKHHS